MIEQESKKAGNQIENLTVGRVIEVSGVKLSESDIARFLAKVDQCGLTQPHMATPCHAWTAGKYKSGYGSLQAGGKSIKAHRIAFILGGGIFPQGKNFVCHHCDYRACVNPAHLFPGDNQDNMTDRTKKGRGNIPRGDANGSRIHPERRPRGERHANSKLTEANVAHIRSSSLSGPELCRELGVGRSQINKIRRGEARRPFILTPGPA